MKEGWDATGRLKPLWKTVGGRDALAKKAGITPAGTLSAYNSGKRSLGRKNANRLAAALGVTIFDLGAPAVQAESREELSVLVRLAALEDKVDAQGKATTQALKALRVGMQRLEQLLDAQVPPAKRRSR